MPSKNWTTFVSQKSLETVFSILNSEKYLTMGLTDSFMRKEGEEVKFDDGERVGYTP